MYDVYNPDADNQRRINKRRRREAKARVNDAIRDTLKRRREADEEAARRRVVNEEKIRKAKAKERKREQEADDRFAAKIFEQLSVVAAEMKELMEQATNLNRRVVEYEEAVEALGAEMVEGRGHDLDSSYESE